MSRGPTGVRGSYPTIGPDPFRPSQAEQLQLPAPLIWPEVDRKGVVEVERGALRGGRQIKKKRARMTAYSTAAGPASFFRKFARALPILRMVVVPLVLLGVAHRSRLFRPPSGHFIAAPYALCCCVAKPQAAFSCRRP